MIEKNITNRMYHKINQYVKPNNKCIKDYDKQRSLISHVLGWAVSNIYVWSMSQSFLVNGFKWRKYGLRFDEKFIESYYGGSDRGSILEVDVKYPKRLHELNSDLNSGVVYITFLKQALNHGLKLKKYTE